MGISEIMLEICLKYRKLENIMLQIWEENLNFVCGTGIGKRQRAKIKDKLIKVYEAKPL